MIKQKKKIQFDLDNTLVNFQSGIDQLPLNVQKEYEGRLDEVEGIFGIMVPNEGAVEAYNELDKYYECHICSTSPWENISAASDKVAWVKKYLPSAYKNVTLTHHKGNVTSDYLIDDRPWANGADKFTGEVIPFSHEGYETWNKIVNYLLTKDGFK